jgi:hypothetical protein
VLLPGARWHWTLRALGEKWLKVGAELGRGARQAIFPVAPAALRQERFWALEDVTNRDTRDLSCPCERIRTPEDLLRVMRRDRLDQHLPAAFAQFHPVVGVNEPGPVRPGGFPLHFRWSAGELRPCATRTERWYWA